MLTIIDQGAGMPPQTVDKVLKGEILTNKINGHGLGLDQVRDALKNNLGELQIHSQVGTGTKVRVLLPKAKSPLWFSLDVKITNNSHILILDDDPDVHLLWQAKLDHILKLLPEVSIKHFDTPDKVLDYIKPLNQEEMNSLCLLFDYELIGYTNTGLDLIKQIGVKRALIVTSNYANSELHSHALGLGVKILPKELVPQANITFDEGWIPHSKHVDAVWVDDAILEIGNMIYRDYKHLNIKLYEDPFTFLEEIDQYPLSTKIILDMNYFYDGDERLQTVNGITIAEKAYHLGYRDLYLCTSEDLPAEIIPSYLKCIHKDEVERRGDFAFFGLPNELKYDTNSDLQPQRWKHHPAR